jgi:hypothetical protein
MSQFLGIGKADSASPSSLPNIKSNNTLIKCLVEATCACVCFANSTPTSPECQEAPIYKHRLEDWIMTMLLIFMPSDFSFELPPWLIPPGNTMQKTLKSTAHLYQPPHPV